MADAAFETCHPAGTCDHDTCCAWHCQECQEEPRGFCNGEAGDGWGCVLRAGHDGKCVSDESDLG